MARITSYIFLVFFVPMAVFAQPDLRVSGAVEWESLRINATVSLDLASAGIRLPAGRTQGESLISAGFLSLIRPGLMQLQVDSSSTVADLIERGEFTMQEMDAVALGAHIVPPALSPDMRRIFSSFSISMENLSSPLIRHSRPSPVIRVLNPVSTARYTGIIIIAVDELPVHGMRSFALPVPCLFPKIWDSEMNLIYERNMLHPANTSLVRYSSLDNIFMRNHPSGLSAELREIAGDRPLRIFAQGVFGVNPTDLIIDRSDALLIVSSEENRSLLTQGRVVFILDDSVLRSEF